MIHVLGWCSNCYQIIMLSSKSCMWCIRDYVCDEYCVLVKISVGVCMKRDSVCMGVCVWVCVYGCVCVGVGVC